MNQAPSRTGRPIAFNEALESSPALARLAGMVRQSGDMLRAVESLIPSAMRQSVKAGPLEGNAWCLLVTGNAAAAKVRQLVPAIQQRLTSEGWSVNSIRLKVLIHQKK